MRRKAIGEVGGKGKKGEKGGKRGERGGASVDLYMCIPINQFTRFLPTSSN